MPKLNSMKEAQRNLQVKVILDLKSTQNYFTGWGLAGWVAGKCETITNSALAEAEVDALAELGNMPPQFLKNESFIH